MASLGQLTAGVVHEIKNPLNFVNNFAGLIKDHLGDLRSNPEARIKDEIETIDILSMNAEKISEHVQRADRIVESMMQHASWATGERQVVEVNGFVIGQEIEKAERRLEAATEKYVDEKMGDEAFHRLERRIGNQLRELRTQMKDTRELETNFDRYARYGMALVSDLSGYYQRADLAIKQKMLGLIFPEKLIFEDGDYRTIRLNEAIALFASKNTEIEIKKKDRPQL